MLFKKQERSQIQLALQQSGLFGALFVLRSSHLLKYATLQQAKENLLAHLKRSYPSLPPIAGKEKKLYQIYPQSSWSHTSTWLGLWITTQNHTVGLDIEQINRLHPKVITRISTVTERKLCSSFSGLWTIKEASFKALNHRFPLTTITQVVLTSWQKIHDHPIPIWHFRVRLNLPYLQKPPAQTVETDQAFGIVFAYQGQYFCIAHS